MGILACLKVKACLSQEQRLPYSFYPLMCEFCLGGAEFWFKASLMAAYITLNRTCRCSMLLAKEMTPQKYQVPLPGTRSVTLSGERVFANMAK